MYLIVYIYVELDKAVYNILVLEDESMGHGIRDNCG